MSWQFLKYWSQRVTDKESLQIREELKSIFQYQVKNSWIKDYYWNKNLLLTNPIKEKKDNWDIDLFLYCQNQEEISEIKEKLSNNSKVLMKSNNWNIFSILFEWDSVKKKVQIDIHFIKVSKRSYNYFLHYKVPYFLFLLWYLLKSLNKDFDMKISLKWIFLHTKDHSDFSLKLTNNLDYFLDSVLWMNIDDFNYFDSYEKIAKFFSNLWFNKKDIEELNWKNLDKHKRNNEKFIQIIEMLNWDNKKLYELWNKIQEFINKWNFLIEKEKEKRLKDKEEKEIKNQELKELFNIENLKNINEFHKRNIVSFINNRKELLILRELVNKFKWKEVYLVWWSVRDILLNKKISDFDLTWNVLSKEFNDLIWWNYSEKYWTCFCNFKWLEIEYTPYRKEEWFNWRHVSRIDFETTKESDSERRDFTMNSLLLDLNELKIIDFHNWEKDLNNKLLRTVWNSDSRFKEDYLRILRALRQSVKYWFNIEKETYESMVKNFNWLKTLSYNRIIQEFDKWMKLNDKKYIELLNKYLIDSWINESFLDKIKNELKDSYLIQIRYLIQLIHWNEIDDFDFQRAINSELKSKNNKTREFIYTKYNKYIKEFIDSMKSNNYEWLLIFIFKVLWNFNKKEQIKVLKNFVLLLKEKWEINEDEYSNNKKLIERYQKYDSIFVNKEFILKETWKTWKEIFEEFWNWCDIKFFQEYITQHYK